MLNLINILENGDTLKFCESYNTLAVFLLVRKLLTVICIVAPIILIIMAMVDVIKAVVSGNIDDELKKMGGKLAKRATMIFILFFLPTIINLFAGIVGTINYDASSCWVNATDEKVKALKSQKESDIKSSEENAKKEAEDEENNKKAESENSKKALEEAKKKSAEDDKNNSNATSSTDNGVLSDDLSSDVVENFAAFIAGEAGCAEGGLTGQFLTGAVYINNFYKLYPNHNLDTPVNTTTMCELFTYKRVYEGGSWNCNLTFSKFEQSRGKMTDAQKHQMLTISKIILDKKFTIPSNIHYQAAAYILKNDSALVWGHTGSGASWGGEIYFGAPKGNGISSTDVYGNSVSTNFDDYDSIAKNLYNKYK